MLLAIILLVFVIYKLVKSPVKRFNDLYPSTYTGTVVKLYQPLGAYHFNHGSLSPFCLKVELFLKVCQLPYQNVDLFGTKSPTGKVPYIEHCGNLVTDSSEIIAYLERYMANSNNYGSTQNTSVSKYLPTAQLAADQKAKGILLQRAMEDHLYFIVLYQRWFGSDANFRTYMDYLFNFPAIVRWMIKYPLKNVVQGAIYSQAHSQGSARHSPDQIIESGKADIDAVAALLPTNQSYLFSDTQISIYDICLYGFLCNIYYGPDIPEDFGFRNHLQKYQHLVEYVDRIRDEFFPDSTPAQSSL